MASYYHGKFAGRCLSALCVVALFSTDALAMRTVKVGFFHFNGYHEIDEQGRRSGYGYDFLQYIAKYAGWRYEYVGYDRSWAEMSQMLLEGNIDLVTSSQKTPQRMKQFAFSRYPLGTSAGIVTVRAGDSRYLGETYQLYNGMRVGMLEGSSRNEGFERFARSKGFAFQKVFYSDSKSMWKALQEGREVDAIVTSNLRKLNNEWVVATFEPSEFYAVVRKEDTRLLRELDAALEQALTCNSGLSETLYRRYFSDDDFGKLPYSVQERLYLSRLKAEGKTVLALMNPDRVPMSFIKNGEGAGIMARIAEEISDRSGIPLKILPVSSREEYMRCVERHSACIRLDARDDLFDAEERGYKLTRPYLLSPISQVTRRSFIGPIRSVAAIVGGDLTEVYIRTLKDVQIVHYANQAECVRAVREGRQDAVYLYSYCAQKVVAEDPSNSLMFTLAPNIVPMNFSLAVRSTEDPLLLSILDKTVCSLTEAFVDEIIAEETVPDRGMSPFVRQLYEHPLASAAGVGLTGFFGLLGSIAYCRRKTRRLSRVHEKENERLLSCAFAPNDAAFMANIRLEHVDRKILFDNLREALEPADGLDPLSAGIHPEDRKRSDAFLSDEALRRIAADRAECSFEARVKVGAGRYGVRTYVMLSLPHDAAAPAKVLIFRRGRTPAGRLAAWEGDAVEDGEIGKHLLTHLLQEIFAPLRAVERYLAAAREVFDDEKALSEYVRKSERDGASFVVRGADCRTCGSGERRIVTGRRGD